MIVTGLLSVAMTTPPQAVAAALGVQPLAPTEFSLLVAEDIRTVESEGIQEFVAPEDVTTDGFERVTSDYATMSMGELAAQNGISYYTDSLYINDPNASIQWPFVVGVRLIWEYGMRWGKFHKGIDLSPGDGAPIQAIADGVVRVSTEAGGDYGVHVWVDHVIDEMLVSSHYAHMQYGSLRVEVGDEVKVGDVLGLVGSTGFSLAPHLHFEIQVNGVYVDPLIFMDEYAGTYY